MGTQWRGKRVLLVKALDIGWVVMAGVGVVAGTQQWRAHFEMLAVKHSAWGFLG